MAMNWVRIPGEATAGEIARSTLVSERTARRWRAQALMPEPLARLVAFDLTGEIAPFDADWRGWRLARGQLWSPEGRAWRPGELRAYEYRLALLQELQRELRPWTQRELVLR